MPVHCNAGSCDCQSSAFHLYGAVLGESVAHRPTKWEVSLHGLMFLPRGGFRVVHVTALHTMHDLVQSGRLFCFPCWPLPSRITHPC